MTYDIHGAIVQDSFAENMTMTNFYDSTTNANYVVIRVFRTKRDGTKQYPFLRYPTTSSGSATVPLRTTAASLAETEGWDLVITAGLGVSASQPIDGVAVENGVVINDDAATYHAGAIPLTIDANGNLATASASATASSLVSAGAVSATCGFCAIVTNYAAVSSFPTVQNVDHFTQNAQRQIIGQFGNGDYAILSCAGRSEDNSDGWTLAEAQTVCIRHGLKFAYCLDGGKSVATYLRRHGVYDFMAGTTRVVPSFIVFNGTDTFSVPSA